jgi:hypothetical protein
VKVHARKKAFRRMCKQLAKDGKIVNSAGQWVNRSSGGNAMNRDFHPQAGK